MHRERNERVAAEEHPRVLGIPLIRRLRPVRVEPPVVVIVLHVEHVQVAVGVRPILYKGLPNHHLLNTLKVVSHL